MAATAPAVVYATTGDPKVQAAPIRLINTGTVGAWCEARVGTFADNIALRMVRTGRAPFARAPLPGGAARRLTTDPVPRMHQAFVTAVVQASVPRVPNSRRFHPRLLTGPIASALEGLTMCGLVQRREELTFTELSVRYVLVCSSTLRPDDCYTAATQFVPGLTTAALDYCRGLDEPQLLKEALALGTAVLCMVAQRPGVLGVSQGVRRQVMDVARQLGYEGEDATDADFSNVLAAYVRNMDVLPLVQTMASVEFNQNPAMSAFFRRCNAGCSHLNAIATAFYATDTLSAWEHISTEEWRRFSTALDRVTAEPLLLHPTNRADPSVTSDMRATAMPGLMLVALTVLPFLGHTSWLEYNNKPALTIVCGMPCAEFENLICTELYVSMAVAKVRYLEAEGRMLTDALRAAVELRLPRFIQAPNRVQKRGTAAAVAGTIGDRYTFTNRGGLREGPTLTLAP